MRRRCLAVVATSVLVGIGLGACDTDDGRDMREPTEMQRWRLEGTSTTTTTTTTLPPTTPPVLATTAEGAAGDSAALSPDTTDVSNSLDAPADASVAAADGSASAASQAALAGPGPDGEAADSSAGAAGPAGIGAPWADGGAIGAEFTCDGAGAAPSIEWAAPPAGTVELALTVVDDDANGYVHWAVFGLPATAGSIGGGAPLTAGIEGRNSKSGTGWTGLCPPAGTAHGYRVTVHFLDQQLETTEDQAPLALVAAIEAASFGEVSITGTYERTA